MVADPFILLYLISRYFMEGQQIREEKRDTSLLIYIDMRARIKALPPLVCLL